MGQIKVPGYFQQKNSFNDSLKKIIHETGLDSTWDTGEDGIKRIRLEEGIEPSSVTKRKMAKSTENKELVKFEEKYSNISIDKKI